MPIHSTTNPSRNPRRRNARFAFALAPAFVLAACAVAPLPQLPNETPARWQQGAADAQAPAPDLRGWWHAFGDAELDRLVDVALQGNLGIAQAALRVEGARALDLHAGDSHLPQFGFRTYAEPTPDSSASYFQAGFDAKWEFGLFGRGGSEARIAAADLGLARSDEQAARVSVVAEVVRSWIELRAAQQRRALLEATASEAQQREDLAATRERLRLASRADVERARAELAQARAAVIEPEARIAQSRRQLGVLLGTGGMVEVADGPAPVVAHAAMPSDVLPVDLLRTRPEIRRAEADVLKSAGEAGVARADLYPRFGLGGALTYSARVIGHTHLSETAGIVTFGPAIDIPLFDWGARRAVSNARDKALSASLLAYRQAVLEGVAEVESALDALQAKSQACAAARAGVDALAAQDDAAATLRRLGLADGVERSSAATALAEAKLQQVQAEQERSLAFVALYKALGGAPLPPADGAAP